jgi:hypothetical protein
VGPVEGTGPNHFHPRYGEKARPARGGGTIDGRDIEHRASYCMNLEASSGGSADDEQTSKEMTSKAAERDNRRDGCTVEVQKSGGNDGRDEGGGNNGPRKV